MLLGEYEHSIDDKNRLTLPAKFRREFEDGIVVTRGLDTCLVAYAPDAWQALVDSTLTAFDLLSQKGRRMHRRFYGSAVDAVPDKQGRVTIPSVLLAHAKLDRDVVIAGVNDHLEIWDRAAWRREIAEAEGSAEDVDEGPAAHGS